MIVSLKVFLSNKYVELVEDMPLLNVEGIPMLYGEEFYDSNF